MNRFLALALATTALSACATQQPPIVAEAAPAATPVAEAPPAPKPQYGTFGFDTAGMDTSILPGDDFYEYANGTWAKNTPIPADKSNYGMFTMLDDLSRNRTRTLIEECGEGSEQPHRRRLRQLHRPGRGRGEGPDRRSSPWLNQIRALDSRAGLAKLYADAAQLRSAPRSPASSARTTRRPINISCPSSRPASACPTATIICRRTPSWSRPRRSYLAASDEHADPCRRGQCRGSRQGDRSAFETRSPQASWTQVDSRDATKTYNKYDAGPAPDARARASTSPS